MITRILTANLIKSFLLCVNEISEEKSTRNIPVDNLNQSIKELATD